MFGHGLGPARQRGAIGLLSAGTLSLALLLLVLVVDSGRLNLEKRKLQRVADTAALEAVSRGGKCIAPSNNAALFARESAARNDFPINENRSVSTACGTLVTGADFVRVFTADPQKADAIQVTARHRVPGSIAAGILALFSQDKTGLTTQLSASAVAATPLPPVASLTVRSTLLTVDSSKSDALNALIGGLLGGALKINAVGWQGILNTDISLLKYLDALALELKVTVGDYDRLLKTNASVGELLQAAINVLQESGSLFSAQINNLKAIQLIAPGTKILNLKDLITIQNGTDKAALDVNLQLFNLIQGFVQLSNKKSAVDVELPINVLGLVAVTIKTKVIEPAQISAIGNPQLIQDEPIFVRTAQVRTLVSVKLNIVGLVNGVLGLVPALLDVVLNLLHLVLGTDCCIKRDIFIGQKLDLVLEAASGSATVTGFSCDTPEKKSLSVLGTTSAVRLMVGQIDPTHLFSSKKLLTVDEYPLLDVGTQKCKPFSSDCTNRQAYAGGGIGIKIDADVLKTERAHLFTAPPPINKPPVYYSFSGNNVVGSLKYALNGIQLIHHEAVLGNLLDAVLGLLLGVVNTLLGVLATVVSDLLSPLLDPLLNGLLAGLGIDVAKVEVGANLSCNPGGRAVLVI